jgi:hypothetical protein
VWWTANLVRKLLAVLLWLALVTASGVGAFSSGAGSCDGVGGYHWDTYYNRRIQGLTLSQHGMQFAINNVAFPLDDDEEKGDHIVTVVELTPESNFTALLTIVATSVPFKGALIRVETAETTAVFNDNSSGISSSYSAPSFVLEAQGENAQVMSRCSVDTVQAVTHTNNWPKTQLAALLSNVPMEDTLWTMDVTVVECNNATDSIYSHARYRILTQTAPSALTAGTLNSSGLPNVSTPLWYTAAPSPSMIPLNSTSNSTTSPPHPSFSLNNTAAPTMADVALDSTTPFGPYNTTSPLVAPAPMLPTVLTMQPTVTALPSTTPTPTHSQVCPLCGISDGLTTVARTPAATPPSSANDFVNSTTWQPDAVVVFFNTYITCRDLAKNAARYTDHTCRAAMAAARAGCGCQTLLAENTSGTTATTRLPTASPVSNVFATPEPPPSPPPTYISPTFALESSSDDDGPGCVLCPVTMRAAFVQKWSDGQNSVDIGHVVRCSEVEENPDAVVPTLWNALQSCSKVQQAVAQSCGCSFVGSLAGQKQSSSSLSLSASLSSAALSMTAVVVLCTMYAF